MDKHIYWTKRLWIVKRLKQKGANLEDLIDIYEKQVRSILEFGVPVWNSNVTQQVVSDVEQVQKSFLHIVLDSDYTSYGIALNIANLESLEGLYSA